METVPVGAMAVVESMHMSLAERRHLYAFQTEVESCEKQGI